MPRKKLKRSRPRDPLAPSRRLSVSARSEAELSRRLARITQIGDDVRAGLLPAKEGDRQIRAMCGAATVEQLTGHALWRAFEARLPPVRKKPYEQRWRLHLRDTFGATLVDAWGPEVLDEWKVQRLAAISERGRPFSHATVQGAFAVLASMVGHAIGEKWIGARPWGRWYFGADPLDDGTFSRPYPDSVRDVVALLAAALAHDQAQLRRAKRSDTMARLAFLLLVGARRSEGAAVTWDAVHLDLPPGAAWVSLRTATKLGWRQRTSAATPVEQTKGAAANAMRMPEVCAEILRAHRQNLRAHGLYADAGPVFPRSDGAARSDPQLVRVDTLRAIATDAGLPGAERFSLHCLRHGFATLESAGGASLRELMLRLRVKSPEIAIRYAHGRGGDQMAQVFSPLDAELGFQVKPLLPSPGDLKAQTRKLVAAIEAIPQLAPRAQTQSARAISPGEIEGLARASRWAKGQAHPPRLRVAIEACEDDRQVLALLREWGVCARRAATTHPKGQGYLELARAWDWQGGALPPPVRLDVRRAGEKARAKARRAGLSAKMAASRARKAAGAISASFAAAARKARVEDENET